MVLFRFSPESEDKWIQNMPELARFRIGNTEAIVKCNASVPKEYQWVIPFLIEAYRNALEKFKAVIDYPQMELIIQNVETIPKEANLAAYNKIITGTEITAHELARADVDDFMRGKRRIYAYTEPLLAYILTNEKKGISPKETTTTLMTHEMIHMISYKMQDYIEMQKRIRKRHEQLAKKSKYYTEFIGINADFGINGLRYMLFKFISCMCLEGIASYLELQREINIKKWNQDYLESCANARRINIEFDELADKIKVQGSWLEMAGVFQDLLYKYSYSIGYHIASTIVFGLEPDEAMKTLMRLKRDEFIYTYEEIMLSKFNKQPIISYTSGKGIFDYKQAVEKLWNATNWRIKPEIDQLMDNLNTAKSIFNLVDTLEKTDKIRDVLSTLPRNVDVWDEEAKNRLLGMMPDLREVAKRVNQCAALIDSASQRVDSDTFKGKVKQDLERIQAMVKLALENMRKADSVFSSFIKWLSDLFPLRTSAQRATAEFSMFLESLEKARRSYMDPYPLSATIQAAEEIKKAMRKRS